MGNNPLKVAAKRMTGAGIPPIEEVERFGMDGEEVIANLLWERFASCSACGTLHGNGNLLQLPLHIANGNASLTNGDKYDILIPKDVML